MKQLAAGRRFAALAVAAPHRVAELAERVLDATGDVELLSVPGPATMLVELTESVGGQPYHLCEVVVSEASVTVDGCRGDAVVLGLDAERALAAALCDAAAEAGLFPAEIDGLVTETLAAAERDRARRADAVAATRIDLEVLG
ncbi:MAG: hypothetical protein AUI14_18325 [Actinobacteria bacterium 13_2_20CM_2_71_6]|nr:MAG: hypothetical protein AUI14_18325 [Actinobacteria bacterium 13_2_20CM_2_71_6]